MDEELKIHIFGDATLPTLVYLPGLHGDWTMIPAFRVALNNRIRFVEITYPRLLTCTIPDHARAISQALLDAGITHGWLLGESFGSQYAWELKNLDDQAATSTSPLPPIEGEKAGRSSSLSSSSSIGRAKLPLRPDYNPEGIASSSPGLRASESATLGKHAKDISPSPLRGERAGVRGRPSPTFHVKGIILAAGFVKHPLKHGPRMLQHLGHATRNWFRLFLFKIEARCIMLQHRRIPEAVAGAHEFLARRTPLDLQAMRYRLKLLENYDPRSIARRTTIPVHYLAGSVDPLIPWPIVRNWLRKNCPGYRGGKTLWLSHHNVLLCAARSCARQVLHWMSASNK